MLENQSELQGVSPAENPKAASSSSFEFGDLIASLKAGDKKPQGLELFERVAGKLRPEQENLMMSYLVENEGCSQEFALKFMHDKTFRKRVIGVNRNFAENGEKIDSLREVEIWTELVDSKSDDIGPLLKATNLTRSFGGLKELAPNELRNFRIKELRESIEDLEECPEKTYAMTAVNKAFQQAGIPEGNWAALFADEEALEAFLHNPELSEMYLRGVGGKLEALHRRIDLRWNVHPDGSRTPMMNVGQIARNERTGNISRMGIDIELEKRIDPSTGEVMNRRVAKEMVIVIDQDARSKQEGIRFLLDKLNLVKEYKLDEMEFKANLQVGSYVWARIADMDVPSMAKLFLPPEEIAAIGPEPWDAARMKEAKAKVFESHVMPVYRKQFEAVIQQLPEEVRTEQESSLREGLMQLDAKAKEGSLTMEDLAEFGKGMDLAGFTKEGNVVGLDDSSAHQRGHIGKAAIMGIPWMARIGLDRRSLSALIDKLNKGKPLSSMLMKAGLYMFH